MILPLETELFDFDRARSLVPEYDFCKRKKNCIVIILFKKNYCSLSSND